MNKENKTSDKQQNGNDFIAIVSNRFFTIYGKKRQTPNEFTEFAKAREEFMNEIYKALRIPQIVEWLAKRLK